VQFNHHVSKLVLTGTENSLVHVHTDFWEKARRYVANRGALYTSVGADAAIPGMAELFGARLADHASVSDVTLRIVASFGDRKPGAIVTDTNKPRACRRRKQQPRGQADANHDEPAFKDGEKERFRSLAAPRPAGPGLGHGAATV